MENKSFTATLEIIGINPFVSVPEEVLNTIFEKAGRNKSPIPVKGTVNGKEFKQNLMKYLGEWRLYVNLIMLKNSPKRIGEIIEVVLEYDDSDRSISIHPQLEKAIKESSLATENFEKLIPSRRHELIRYINNLKTEVSIQRNIEKIIRHLHGETDFLERKLNKLSIRH
ncbi:YdeI/OmpD-associated family protein [Chryseobacterium sp. 1B4]